MRPTPLSPGHNLLLHQFVERARADEKTGTTAFWLCLAVDGHSGRVHLLLGLDAEIVHIKGCFVSETPFERQHDSRPKTEYIKNKHNININ